MSARSRNYFNSPGNFRRALNAAVHEHDGAWRDPMAMKLLACRYNVDLDHLTKEAEHDGRVVGRFVSVEPGAYLEIIHWTCFHEGRGATVEALQWLRDQGYRHIGVKDATPDSLPYWSRMEGHGLVDAVMLAPKVSSPRSAEELSRKNQPR